jgi:hypothetical protein
MVPMITFELVRLDTGLWAVERFVDGESHGFTWGRYRYEGDARIIAGVLTRLEARVAGYKPPTPRDTAMFPCLPSHTTAARGAVPEPLGRSTQPDWLPLRWRYRGAAARRAAAAQVPGLSRSAGDGAAD